MKKKLITIMLCLSLVATVCALAFGCGSDSNTEHTNYTTYDFTFDETLGGLVLDVVVKGELSTTEVIALPESSYYYKDSATATEETDHTDAKAVVAISARAFKNTSITSVTLPTYLKTIGEEAFANCSDLVTVTMGESLKTIGDSAFTNCSGLTTITATKTAISEVGDNAFNSCQKLKKVGFTFASSATIGEKAFFYNVAISSMDISGVTYVGSKAFTKVDATKITVGNADTSAWASDWNGNN